MVLQQNSLLRKLRNIIEIAALGWMTDLMTATILVCLVAGAPPGGACILPLLFLLFA